MASVGQNLDPAVCRRRKLSTVSPATSGPDWSKAFNKSTTIRLCPLPSPSTAPCAPSSSPGRKCLGALIARQPIRVTPQDPQQERADHVRVQCAYHAVVEAALDRIIGELVQ